MRDGNTAFGSMNEKLSSGINQVVRWGQTNVLFPNVNAIKGFQNTAGSERRVYFAEDFILPVACLFVRHMFNQHYIECGTPNKPKSFKEGAINHG